MLTHIGQGDVLVCLNCGKPIVLTNKTFTLDCFAEYIECPNCKAKYDVQVYHARGSKILGKEAELIIDEANAYRGEEMTREEAIKELELIAQVTMWNERRLAVEMAIEALQQEPKHGKWIESKIPNELYVCSNCGGACWSYDYERTIVKSNYCPYCGVKMDKE